MINLQTKFEVSDYLQRRYERQRKNVKILVLSHILWDLEVTQMVHLWLSGKRLLTS